MGGDKWFDQLRGSDGYNACVSYRNMARAGSIAAGLTILSTTERRSIGFIGVFTRVHFQHDPARYPAKEPRSTRMANDVGDELDSRTLEVVKNGDQVFDTGKFKTDVKVVRPIDLSIARIFDNYVKTIALENNAASYRRCLTSQVSHKELARRYDILRRKARMIEVHGWGGHIGLQKV